MRSWPPIFAVSAENVRQRHAVSTASARSIGLPGALSDVKRAGVPYSWFFEANSSAAWACLSSFTLRRQERQEFSGKLLRRLLGHVMTAVQTTAAQVSRPWLPDGEDIAIESFEVIA